MAKYRLLTQEELEPLSEEFLKYLVVANILPEQWELLKKEKIEEAEKHLAVFSDLVFDKIMQQHQYLERITSAKIEAYHFMKNKAEMVALVAKNASCPSLLETNLADIDIRQFDLIRGSKSYQKSREEEMFQMTQQECVPSDGNWYKKLLLIATAH